MELEAEPRRAALRARSPLRPPHGGGRGRCSPRTAAAARRDRGGGRAAPRRPRAVPAAGCGSACPPCSARCSSAASPPASPRPAPRCGSTSTMEDRAVDLVAEGYDVVVRLNPRPDSALVGRCFARDQPRDRRGAPRSAEALRRAPASRCPWCSGRAMPNDAALARARAPTAPPRSRPGRCWSCRRCPPSATPC